MNTAVPRAVVALFALVFVLAACASSTGSEWTFAPVTASVDSADAADEAPADAAAETPAEAPADAAAETPAEAPAEAATEPAAAEAPAAAGAPRVITIQADAALRFTDAAGEQLRDIPVTPGETILFQVNNTAGFEHNFYIGQDAELVVPGGSTEHGIPNWSTGVQELEWVVPEDITGLKFGCTVPGHYALMQGTFSLSS